MSSAIARALGAGDRDRAESLATHALLIAVLFGLVFMLGMLAGGPRLLELLGGRGNVLAQAIAYSHIYFGGAVLIWLVNILASILRGTGNMKLPSLMIVNSAICQIILGRTLGLGQGLLNLTMVCPSRPSRGRRMPRPRRGRSTPRHKLRLRDVTF